MPEPADEMVRPMAAEHDEIVGEVRRRRTAPLDTTVSRLLAENERLRHALTQIEDLARNQYLPYPETITRILVVIEAALSGSSEEEHEADHPREPVEHPSEPS